MLTAKQEAFAAAVANGSNYSDAYRLAYDCDGSSPETIWNDASDLAAHPEVAPRIQELRREFRVYEQAEFVAECRANVRLGRELKQIGASNGALGLAGKASGLLVDRVEHSGQVQHLILPGLTLEQLRALSAELEAGVVEGEVLGGDAIGQAP